MGNESGSRSSGHISTGLQRRSGWHATLAAARSRRPRDSCMAVDNVMTLPAEQNTLPNMLRLHLPGCCWFGLGTCKEVL